MKFLANQRLATRISIITTAITLAGMLLLWFTVSNNIAAIVKNDITNQMTDAVESRASIINSYVSSAEEYMSAFALGQEVRQLLLNPDDPQLLGRVQTYTENFAAVKGVFEGLYIATPNTHVLTHTSPSAVGMTTRSGDSLRSFQDTILARRELTNLGIMKSPGTGSMILSMYYPVFEGQRCIGYVGAGVYAANLMDVLLGLDIKGLPNSEYVFLNAESGVYLYHEDEALLNTETPAPGSLEIIRRVQADGSTQAGTYSYRDENGVNQLPGQADPGDAGHRPGGGPSGFRRLPGFRRGADPLPGDNGAVGFGGRAGGPYDGAFRPDSGQRRAVQKRQRAGG